jgi:hypothetical protein
MARKDQSLPCLEVVSRETTATRVWCDLTIGVIPEERGQFVDEEELVEIQAQGVVGPLDEIWVVSPAF